jgi:hypothetical protein
MAAMLALHSVGNVLILQKIVLPLLANDSLLMVSRVLYSEFNISDASFP